MHGIPDTHNARSSPSTRKLDFGVELHSSELISCHGRHCGDRLEVAAPTAGISAPSSIAFWTSAF